MGDVRGEVEGGEGTCRTRCNEAPKVQCLDCLHAIALTTALHTLMKKHQYSDAFTNTLIQLGVPTFTIVRPFLTEKGLVD